jgi:hypothetical protein
MAKISLAHFWKLFGLCWKRTIPGRQISSLDQGHIMVVTVDPNHAKMTMLALTATEIVGIQAVVSVGSMATAATPAVMAVPYDVGTAKDIDTKKKAAGSKPNIRTQAMMLWPQETSLNASAMTIYM